MHLPDMISDKKKFFPFLVFAVFAAWMLLQYSRVFIYFDDFGYLSLSYGYNVADVAGHSYGPEQMLEFMAAHYSEANGRLLYTGLYLFLYMLGGLRLVQLAMAFTVPAILFLIYSMTDRRELSWPQSSLLAAFLCLMFGTISLAVNRQGTYWFAASFLYLTPCIPFLLLSSLYLRTEGQALTLGKLFLLCLLSFISGFSQEQWWVSACVMIASILLYKWVRNRRSGIGPADLLILLCAFAGGCIIALSPAVAARMTRDSANTAFSSLSLPEKIITNTKGILTLFTTGDNQPFLSVFLALMFLMALWMAVKKLGFVRLHTAYLICCALFFIEPRFIENHRFVLWLPFLFFTAAEVLQFYVSSGEWNHLFIFIAAVASVGCMVIVPEFPTRSLLPFLLLSFLLAGDIACCWLKETKLIPAVFCLLLLARPSVANLEAAYFGYSANYKILMENEEILEAASLSVKSGVPVGEILLKRQSCYDYGGDMMYQEPFGFMEYWVKEYYDLPADMIITYEE